MKPTVFTKISSELHMWKKNSKPHLGDGLFKLFGEDPWYEEKLKQFITAQDILEKQNITFRPDMPSKFVAEYVRLYYKTTNDIPIMYTEQKDENKNSLSIKMTFPYHMDGDVWAFNTFKNLMSIYEIDQAKSTPDNEVIKPESTVLPWGCLFKKEGNLWSATNTMFAFWMFKCLNKRC